MTGAPIVLTDETDPRLEAFLSRRIGAPELKDFVVLDGPKLVERYQAEIGPLTSILARPEFYEAYPHIVAAERFTATKAFLADVIGFKYHQGVIAVAPRPKPVSMSEVGSRIAVLSGLTDAENVGAIARLCDAFDFRTLIVDPETCSPLVRRAIRVSMGSVFRLKVHHAADLAADLSYLRDAGYAIWGAALGGNEKLLASELPSRLAIVLGSEGAGISPSILKICTDVVTIPMTAAIDSLNVSHAASILMHAVFARGG